MSDEISVEVNGPKLDNRSKVMIGRRLLTKQVDKIAIVFSRDEPTEYIITLKPPKSKVKAKAVKSDNLFDKVVGKLLDKKKD